MSNSAFPPSVHSSASNHDDELIALRSQVADLQRQLRERTTLDSDERAAHVFRSVVENAVDAFAVADFEGRVTYVNDAFRRLFRCHDDCIGVPIANFVTPEGLALLPPVLAEVQTQNAAVAIFPYKRFDGSTFDGEASAFLVRDQEGTPLAMAVQIRDITERQRAEADRIRLQEQVIEAQQAALRELSTPLIPITEGVVAMPLIGSVDSSRAQQIIESLLNGVTEMRARTAILDITGVPVVDTQVASALLRAAQAVKLLGATVILTGIRPEVAQTLVGLGLDLGGVVTRSTLQSGIASAMQRDS